MDDNSGTHGIGHSLDTLDHPPQNQNNNSGDEQHIHRDYEEDKVDNNNNELSQFDNNNNNNDDNIEEKSKSQTEKKRSRKSVNAPRLVPREHITESERLDTNQFLYETASRMDNVIEELVDYTNTLSDTSKENESKRQEVLKNMRQSILPMLYIASNSMKQTAMSFAPFAGTDTVHKRKDVQKKRDVVDKTSELSPALQMINDFVKSSIVDIPEYLTREEPSVGKVSSRLLKAKPESSANRHDDTETISILRPYNGTLYTKSEAIYCCKLYPKGSLERGRALRAMRAKGYTPASVKTIQRLVDAYENGHPPACELWNGMGRVRQHEIDPAVTAAAAVAAAAPKPFGRPSPDDMIVVTLDKKSGKVMEPGRKRKADGEDIDDCVSDKKKKKKKKTDSSSKAGVKQSAKETTAKLPASKPSPTKKKEKTVTPEALAFPLPEPQHGTTYKKTEAVEIALKYKVKSQQRKWAIEAMCHRGK